jgi:hypothetical protein
MYIFPPYLGQKDVSALEKGVEKEMFESGVTHKKGRIVR